MYAQKHFFHGLTTLWFDENYTIHLKHPRSLLKRKANPWFPTQTGQLGPWWTGRCLISSGMCGPHPFLPGASTTHLPWRPLLICLFLLEGYFLWSLSWSARQDFFFLTLFPKHLRIHDSHVALNTVAVYMAHLISLIRLSCELVISMSPTFECRKLLSQCYWRNECEILKYVFKSYKRTNFTASSQYLIVLEYPK